MYTVIVFDPTWQMYVTEYATALEALKAAFDVVVSCHEVFVEDNKSGKYVFVMREGGDLYFSPELLNCKLL